MSPVKVAVYQILNALIFAILMIASAWYFKGTEHWLMSQQMLIAVWWIPFSWLLSQSSGCRC